MKENTAGTSILEQLRKAWKIVSRRDVALFVISLFAAYVIWIVHNMSLNYTRMARVLIEARTNIDGHSNLSANTATLQARLRTTGYEWVMMNSRATSGKSQIVDIDPSDLHYASGDTWFITSTELNKYSPYIFSENTVLEIVQDTLFFRFPEQNYRRVPVQAVCSIDFKSQYASVGGVKMIPDSVGVYGEPYLIDNIEKVYTERFELSNLSGTATGECKLVPIKGTRLSHEKVAYVVDVSRYVEMTEDIPILPRNVPSDRSLAIYPSTARVSFRCNFPVTVNPKRDVTIWIDYYDFQKSLHGQCLPHVSGVGDGILDYRIIPEVFECVESVR